MLPTTRTRWGVDRPVRPSRPGAVGLALVALALAVHLPAITRTAAYLGVVGGLLLLTAVLGAVRLWYVGRVLCRSGACATVLLVAIGQLLNATLGLPGAESLRHPFGPWAAVALTGEACVLVAVLRRTRVPLVPGIPDRP